MKCNPFVSAPIAIGLFALAGSQVFSTLGELAIDREQRVSEQSLAVLNAENAPGLPRPPHNGVGRAMAVQQLRIVDATGNPVILLSGTPAGAVIEMRSPNGERVMSMHATPSGGFRHEVLTDNEVIAQFGTEPDKGTFLRLSSPGLHSTVTADLQTRGSTLTAFNTLRMDGRAGLYQWLSLAGAEINGDEFLPGQMVSSVVGLGKKESVHFADHLLYSPEELRTAIAELLLADE